jgi:hypothetical protein
LGEHFVHRFSQQFIDDLVMGPFNGPAQPLVAVKDPAPGPAARFSQGGTHVPRHVASMNLLEERVVDHNSLLFFDFKIAAAHAEATETNPNFQAPDSK